MPENCNIFSAKSMRLINGKFMNNVGIKIHAKCLWTFFSLLFIPMLLMKGSDLTNKVGKMFIFTDIFYLRFTGFDKLL